MIASPNGRFEPLNSVDRTHQPASPLASCAESLRNTLLFKSKHVTTSHHQQQLKKSSSSSNYTQTRMLNSSDDTRFKRKPVDFYLKIASSDNNTPLTFDNNVDNPPLSFSQAPRSHSSQSPLRRQLILSSPMTTGASTQLG